MKIIASHTGIVVAAILLAAGAGACDKQASTKGRTALAPDASAQVIGKEPAPPTGDPPGTTPVMANTEVSKTVEVSQMPLPGQPNDHSNVAALPSQKAESADALKNPEAAKTANSGPPQEERKTR